ncbi:hypothetical protein ACVXZY_09355 [Staphylococcus aureus]
MILNRDLPNKNLNRKQTSLQLLFKVKDKNKFKKVTEEISKKRDNVMVVWLDFKKGDSYKKEAQKKNPKFISAASVDQPINSDSVEYSVVKRTRH